MERIPLLNHYSKKEWLFRLLRTLIVTLISSLIGMSVGAAFGIGSLSDGTERGLLNFLSLMGSFSLFFFTLLNILIDRAKIRKIRFEDWSERHRYVLWQTLLSSICHLVLFLIPAVFYIYKGVGGVLTNKITFSLTLFFSSQTTGYFLLNSVPLGLLFVFIYPFISFLFLFFYKRNAR